MSIFRPSFVLAAALCTLGCSTKELASVSARVTDAATGAPDAPAANDSGPVAVHDGPPPISPIDCSERQNARDSGFLAAFFTVHTTLASYCAAFACPHRTTQEFLAEYSCGPAPDSGPSLGTVPRSVGCGIETVGAIGMFGGDEFVFDGATGSLVGARIGSDAPFGPCSAAQYVAGRVSDECASAHYYECTLR